MPEIVMQGRPVMEGRQVGAILLLLLAAGALALTLGCASVDLGPMPDFVVDAAQFHGTCPMCERNGVHGVGTERIEARLAVERMLDPEVEPRVYRVFVYSCMDGHRFGVRT